MMSVPFGKPKLLPTTGWERELIEKLGLYLGTLRDFGLPPPVIILLSLLGVKDYNVPYGSFNDTKAPIDRDDLLLPDLFVQDYSTDAATILRPAFDAVWQAGGRRRCLHYDDQGKWVGT